MALTCEELAEHAVDRRACSCHPDDRPNPCEKRYAAGHCWRAAVYRETREAMIELKNRDRNPIQEAMLHYLKRVERALDGTF